MKILLVNQPIGNRGDESAHKGLLRTMVREIPQAEVTVLTVNGSEIFEDSVRQVAVKSPRVKYVIHKPLVHRGLGWTSRCGQMTGMHFLWHLHPGLQSYMQYFKDTDMVMCAPGGICMGLFQNWWHLFNLQCAKQYNKPLVYYGRSVGPFPTKTRANRKFLEISKEMLRYNAMTLIRDKESERIVKELGTKGCVSVVDSAFLDSPKVDIPPVISEQTGDDYFVFVPNLLIWHPAYKGRMSKADIINFFCDALDVLFERYPSSKAVMLPQTFNCGDHRDVLLFREIAQAKADDRIVVIDDTYGSDIQQAIIAKARLIVGSRYHSIVFALNNATPFVALNYEHKISGLLEALSKTDCMIDIEHSLDTPQGRSAVLNQLREMLPTVKADEAARQKAKDIAMRGFTTFKQRFFE